MTKLSKGNECSQGFPSSFEIRHSSFLGGSLGIGHYDPMTLAFRNIRFHWRGNLAVLLGVAVGAAVLAGALFVGDSLRGSLAARAERQANGVTAAWMGARLIDDRLAKQLSPDVIPAFVLRGTATHDI